MRAQPTACRATRAKEGVMHLRTYRGKTMADALAEVKKDLGKDAVILHTRSYRVGGVMGVGGHQEFEITASNQQSARGPTIRERGGSDVPAARSASAPGAASAPDRRPARATPSDEGFSPASFTALGAGKLANSSPTPSPVAPAPLVEVKPPPTPLSQSAQPPKPAAHQPSGQATSQPASLAPRSPATSLASGLATRVELAPTDPAALAALKEELHSIRGMVGQLLGESRRAAANDPVRAEGVLMLTGLSEPLGKAFVQLQDAGLAPELVDRVVGGVRDELSPAELREGDLVRGCVLKHLAALVPVTGMVPRAGKQTATGRPLVLAFVGPTGVGKTTTIAKLAAVYRLRFGMKVGLVTADTYRIAAVEQLRTYAGIMGLPVHVALSPADVASAIDELADHDVVLLDTAGRSQHDHQRLDELAGFIDAARPDEVHMVLSAAAAHEVSVAAWRRFARLSPTRLILTKLDEAVRFGGIINLLAQALDVHDRPARLSLLSTGQEVPDDLELAHAERLARSVLDGSLHRQGLVGQARPGAASQVAASHLGGTPIEVLALEAAYPAGGDGVTNAEGAPA